MAAKKGNSPARRGGSPGKAKAERALASARKYAARIRERNKTQTARGYGAIGAYFASDYWGERLANADRGEGEAGLEIAGYKLGGVQLGGGVAVAGALGMLGNDTYDEVAYAVGLSVMSSQRGVDRYKTRLEEPPEA